MKRFTLIALGVLLVAASELTANYKRALLLVFLLLGVTRCGGQVERLEHCARFSVYRPVQDDGTETVWTFELEPGGVEDACSWTGQTSWHNADIRRSGGVRALGFSPSGSIESMDVLECEAPSEPETFCGPSGAWADFTLWRGE